jgi:hypothetical protein
MIIPASTPYLRATLVRQIFLDESKCNFPLVFPGDFEFTGITGPPCICSGCDG